MRRSGVGSSGTPSLGAEKRLTKSIPRTGRRRRAHDNPHAVEPGQDRVVGPHREHAVRVIINGQRPNLGRLRPEFHHEPRGRHALYREVHRDVLIVLHDCEVTATSMEHHLGIRPSEVPKKHVRAGQRRVPTEIDLAGWREPAQCEARRGGHEKCRLGQVVFRDNCLACKSASGGQ